MIWSLKGCHHRIQDNFYLIFAILFSLFVIGVNYVWIVKDIAPPQWDQAWYLENSQILYKAIFDNGLPGLMKAFTHALGGVKAPLISLLPLPFYLLFGNLELVAMGVNFLFLLLLSYFLFRLTELISNKKVALLAVLITQTIPLFVGMNRQFFVEYGLATLVVMFMYFLVKSDYYEKKKCNIWLGVLLGLGLLMKILFLFYVAFPVLWIVYLRKKYKQDIFNPLFFKKIFEIVLIGFLIASVWYLPNIKSVLHFAISAGIGELAKNYGSPGIFSWGIIVSYWKMLIDLGISFYYFVLFMIVGLLNIGLFIIYGKWTEVIKRDFNIFLLAWFFVPFLIFTFSVNKDIRYILPIFPTFSIFLSLIAYQLLSKIRSEAVYLLVCLLIILYPAYSILHQSFTSIPIAKGYNILSAPDTRDWKTNEIVEYLYKEMYKQNDPSATNIIAVEHPYLNYNTYSYTASTKNYPYPIYFGNLGYNQENFDSALSIINASKPSFIIFQEGIQSIELTKWLNQSNDRLREIIDNKGLPYERDKIFELSHGVNIILYKKVTK